MLLFQLSIFLWLISWHPAYSQIGQNSTTRVVLVIVEEQPGGHLVGIIPLRVGVSYVLEDSLGYFELGESGDLRTVVQIDREEVQSDVMHLLVQGSPFHLIDVIVSVADINDNSPTFADDRSSVSFQEDARIGQTQLVSTATDLDKGINGTIVEYDIVSGNDENKFGLVSPNEDSPFLFLQVEGNLDRERQSRYLITISARDGGTPPRLTYHQIVVDIIDVNDLPPVFDYSHYLAQVNESTEVGSVVMTVEASDGDEGDNGKVFYSITDRTGQFAIDQVTGVITTRASPLRCYRSTCNEDVVDDKSFIPCDRDSCFITIRARDAGSIQLHSRAYISIRVMDENDHAPVISFHPAFRDSVTGGATIYENAAAGVRVADVNVIDQDRGVNGQNHVTLVDGDDAGHFKLVSLRQQESVFNFIAVRKSLSRKTMPMYNLTIMSTDRGTPPRSAISNLVIIVTDANNYVPEFSHAEYHASVSEIAMPGSLVTCVSAVDKDIGPTSVITYAIESGNDKDWFLIDSVTALVVTSGHLDRELTPRAILNISARDSGTINFVSYTRLHIEIEDENDMTPLYRKPIVQIEMAENVSANGDIVVLTADDYDSGKNGTVTYMLHDDVELLHPGWFLVHSSSGRITVRRALDRELVSSFTIKVIAKDGGELSLSSTATVYLFLIDLNDNWPIFYPETYYVRLIDDVLVGSDVVKVRALDKDSGDYGRVFYSFVGDVFDCFVIDPNTGSISTTCVLYRTNGWGYVLYVTAEDGGKRRSNSMAVVNIIVTGLSDVTLSFLSSHYIWRISEDFGQELSSLGGHIGQVSVDENDNTNVSYFITSGDMGNVFSIDKQGFLRKIKPIDREEKDIYELTVLAIRNSSVGEVKVTIIVLDQNDNKPCFTVNTLEVTMMENWPLGSRIFFASAIDDDVGLNATLKYTLTYSDDTEKIFGIDHLTGLIFLKISALSLEESRLCLTVTVRDHGEPQLISTLSVCIVIIDVNDHTPLFPKAIFTLSVSESTPVIEVLATFRALDEDSGKNGEVRYAIIRGNQEERFGMFPDGSFYVARSLDREKTDVYFLTIQANDNGDFSRSSTLSVTLIITDDNDNAPYFISSSYVFTLAENEPIGTFVGRVSAIDHDLDQNAALMFYLQLDVAGFSIDHKTGSIHTNCVFDREYLVATINAVFFTFDVVVVDGGNKSLSSTCSVKVVITDKNDNIPIFSRILFAASVPENAMINTKVIAVTATDIDAGSNGEVKYAITGGNVNNSFTISETGDVIVVGKLDRENIDHLFLTVIAKDTGETDIGSSTTGLSITITDCNDNAPVFTSMKRDMSVNEGTVIGQLLTVFSAIDLDEGSNGQMYFDITNGNNDETFGLDASSGRLFLVRELDYESKRYHNLNVSVRDDGRLFPLSTYIFFHVHVLDTNDNAPEFTDGFRIINVLESAHDEQVSTLTATDKDSGSFAALQFKIVLQEPDSHKFRIDPLSGDIFVIGFLDRESVDLYELIVTVSDQANDPYSGHTSYRTLQIRITDINDNAPVFVSPVVFIMDSGSRKQRVVANIEARDDDIGENGEVTYSLVTKSNLFSIDSTLGHILLRRDLPPFPKSYELQVAAVDKGRYGQDVRKSAECSITLFVYHADDRTPEFSLNAYSVDIFEGNPPNNLFRIYAAPTSTDVTVSYYVIGISSVGVRRGPIIHVDSNTGVVRSLQVMDREELGEVINIDFAAVEQGGIYPHIGTIQASITLKDINDTPPRFSPSFYNVTYAENQIREKSVIKVTYVDPDSTGQVRLMVLGEGNAKFDVTDDGILFALIALDREETDKYNLMITADDGVHVPASANVMVFIDDVNDNRPEFTQAVYYFQVSEDSIVGSIVAVVEARDADLGMNGHVTYDMISYWGADRFQVNSVLGTCSLIAALNYDTRQIYTLIVVAKDGGYPPLTGTTTVVISVIDENDNPPLFHPASYWSAIHENVSVGTVILSVTATDIDQGPNGQVRYALVGVRNPYLAIDQILGTLYTTHLLDRETQSTHSVVVMATDQAVKDDERLSAMSTVEVHLLDVNDCQPAFISSSKVVVMVAPKNGTVVHTFMATDCDSDSNADLTYQITDCDSDSNADLTYQITAITPPQSPFELDQRTGQLIFISDPQRNEISNCTVTVTVTDGGTPPLSSTQSIFIQAENTTHRTPVFTATEYRCQIKEDLPVGSSILTVKASYQSNDPTGAVWYFIMAGTYRHHHPLFSVNPASGIVQLKKQVDFEKQDEFRLSVVAVDSRLAELSATAHVIISVLDVNDFIPVFDHSPFTAYVQEGEIAGEEDNAQIDVVRVQARDEDTERNSRLTYGLTNVGLTEPGVFNINPTTGMVSVLQKMDREDTPIYIIHLTASDSGFPRLTGTATLTIFVLDANDNAPVFGSVVPYICHVVENSIGVQSLMTITATDKDEGHNSMILYSLTDSHGGKFVVMPQAGDITSVLPSDREQQDIYHLVVIATDQGIPPMSASRTVVVYVDDINDNKPKFQQSIYSRIVSGTVGSGTFVIGVMALDKDSRRNGQVSYALLDNVTSSFQVEPEDGVVLTAQPLSPASTPYVCYVKACDMGEPPLCSTVQVNVLVLPQVAGLRPIWLEQPIEFHVDENTPIGTVVSTVFAHSYRPVSYRIVGGNVDSAFIINQNNGSISIASAIDYEMLTSMKLWLEATSEDPRLASNKKITVLVHDMNDNPPAFNASVYSVSLMENQPIDTYVTKVSAVDPDDGQNKHILYGLNAGSNENSTFWIDPLSGIIVTRNPVVDREGIPFYSLIVEAFDQGKPSLTGTTIVDVIILDRNDNPPVFSGLFSVAVAEDIPLNSLILTLTSNDLDTAVNSAVNYHFLSGLDAHLLSLDPLSGEITNNKNMDAENKEWLRPNVQVSDSAFISTTQVTIHLLDVNDCCPKFLEPVFVFDVYESQRVPTFVGQLIATDQDISSPNNDFYFSLRRPSKLFQLDANSGKIFALRPLMFCRTDDDCRINVHILDVTVTDLGMPYLSSHASVNITVIDYYKQAPVFFDALYTSAVPVNVSVGTEILVVQANHHVDIGHSAHISYSVIGGNGTGYFAVDEHCGEMTVNHALTNQRDRMLVVTVKAEDLGHPVQSSEAEVFIYITDSNNHFPRFSEDFIFMAHIREDVPSGFSIITFSATDSDPGLNGEVRFSIDGGNEDSFFTIHPISGLLTVVQQLDYEAKRQHILNVTSRDQGLFSKSVSHLFTMNVVDIDDNLPVFRQRVFDAFVPENVEPGTTILELQAEDVDSGHNAVIRYSLHGEKTLFSVEKYLGFLIVDGILDYEIRHQYTLTAVVYNPHENITDPVIFKNQTAVVMVYVTSVNEYRPQFQEHFFLVDVSENVEIGSTVATLHAIDRDRGVDGTVYYFFVGDSNLRGFALNLTTGDLTVAARADYESLPLVHVTAMVKNWGSVFGNDTDTCVVKVIVRDANDPPVFTQDIYFVDIVEEGASGVHVFTVTAVDDDDLSTGVSHFSYSIAGGNGDHTFAIDPATGTITSTGLHPLDRELISQYNLTILVEDHGEPPMSDECLLVIRLIDINDNGPKFSPDPLIVHLTGEQPTGTHVITLSDNTIDPDQIHHQGPYTYQSVSDPVFDIFFVEPVTGEVTTITELTSEGWGRYEIPVVAYDDGADGGDKRSSTLTFTVVVDEENATVPTPPSLSPLTVYLTLLDGVSSVGVVADLTSGCSSAASSCNCRLEDGDITLFDIVDTCQLYLRFDVDSDSTYTVSVSCSDSSSTVAINQVTVEVHRFSEALLHNAVNCKLDGIDALQFLDMKVDAFFVAMEGVLEQGSKPVILALHEVQQDLYVYFAIDDANSEDFVIDQKPQKLYEIQISLKNVLSVPVKIFPIRQCVYDPCRHGGKCRTTVTLNHDQVETNSAQHFVLTSSNLSVKNTCFCPPGYHGNVCQDYRRLCGDTFCRNNGTCQDDIRCLCPAGWRGRTCSVDVDECRSDKPAACHNGGTCLNTLGSFTCRCPSGFTGSACQNRARCVSRPCKNAALCEDVKEGGIRCHCRYGYFGELCQHSSFGFCTGSFLVFDPMEYLLPLSIAVYVATVSDRALLLFMPVSISRSRHGYVSLEILDGYVVFTFELSGQSVDPVQIKAKPIDFTDGQWHHVMVDLRPQNASIVVESCHDGVDGGTNCSTPCPSPPHSACQSSVTFRPITSIISVLRFNVGGVDEDQFTVLLRLAKKYPQSHEFVGCMHDFTINGRSMLNLDGSIKHDGISRVCPRQQATSLCQGIFCNSDGNCTDRWDRSECVCSQKWTGARCDERRQPISFEVNSSVSYLPLQSFMRDTLMAKDIIENSLHTKESTLLLKIWMTSSNCILYRSTNPVSMTVLWVQNGALRFASSLWPLDSHLWVDKSVVSGNWHTVLLNMSSNSLSLAVTCVLVTGDVDRHCGQEVATTQSVSFSVVHTAIFPFDSPEELSMSLGGSGYLPDGTFLSGFEGCVSDFRINGVKVPIQGSSTRYKLVTMGAISSGCQAVCSKIPCSSNGTVCVSDGETFHCNLMKFSADLGMSAVVIAIISTITVVFFVAVMTVLCRMRQRWFGKCMATKTERSVNSVYHAGVVEEEGDRVDARSAVLLYNNTFHCDDENIRPLRDVFCNRDIVQETPGLLVPRVASPGNPRSSFVDSTMITEDVFGDCTDRSSDQTDRHNVFLETEQPNLSHLAAIQASQQSCCPTDVCDSLPRCRLYDGYDNSSNFYFPANEPSAVKQSADLLLHRHANCSLTATVGSSVVSSTPPSSSLSITCVQVGCVDSLLAKNTTLYVGSESRGSSICDSLLPRNSFGSHNSRSSSYADEMFFMNERRLSQNEQVHNKSLFSSIGQHQIFMLDNSIQKSHHPDQDDFFSISDLSCLDYSHSRILTNNQFNADIHPHTHHLFHLNQARVSSTIQQKLFSDNINEITDAKCVSSRDSETNDSFTCSEVEYVVERSTYGSSIPPDVLYSELVVSDQNNVHTSGRCACSDSSRLSSYRCDDDRRNSVDVRNTSSTVSEGRQKDVHHSEDLSTLDTLMGLGSWFENLVGVFNDISSLTDARSSLSDTISVDIVINV